MKYLIGNIFTLPSDAICVTTNGIVKHSGLLVMGAGIALEFANRYPSLQRQLGRHVTANGNVPGLVQEGKNIISFPTKSDYRLGSDINLIMQSARLLIELVDTAGFNNVLLPPPGCGLGGLSWLDDVQPIIKPILDDRFSVVFRDTTDYRKHQI